MSRSSSVGSNDGHHSKGGLLAPMIKVTSPNVPVAPAAAKKLGISADPNYQRPPPPPAAMRPYPYDRREMSPPPGGPGNRLYDHYSVYMGPPNTSAISPATSQYVDPVTGIYLGPPAPAANAAANAPNAQNLPPQFGFNTSQPPVQRYQDPEYTEVEFNRGLRPQPQPKMQPPQAQPDPFSRVNSQYNHLPNNVLHKQQPNVMYGAASSALTSPPGAGQPSFQQMSSYQTNRRLN